MELGVRVTGAADLDYDSLMSPSACEVRVRARILAMAVRTPGVLSPLPRWTHARTPSNTAGSRVRSHGNLGATSASVPTPSRRGAGGDSHATHEGEGSGAAVAAGEERTTARTGASVQTPRAMVRGVMFWCRSFVNWLCSEQQHRLCA